jgi:hypothetical protein
MGPVRAAEPLTDLCRCPHRRLERTRTVNVTKSGAEPMPLGSKKLASGALSAAPEV